MRNSAINRSAALVMVMCSSCRNEIQMRSAVVSLCCADTECAILLGFEQNHLRPAGAPPTAYYADLILCTYLITALTPSLHLPQNCTYLTTVLTSSLHQAHHCTYLITVFISSLHLPPLQVPPHLSVESLGTASTQMSWLTCSTAPIYTNWRMNQCGCCLCSMGVPGLQWLGTK